MINRCVDARNANFASGEFALQINRAAYHEKLVATREEASIELAGISSSIIKMNFFLPLTTLMMALALGVPESWASQHRNSGLNRLMAKNRKLYFGTAADNHFLNDSQYRTILKNHHDFGQITSENGQKWMYIEPEQNVFNYTLGDEMIGLANKNSQLSRCHNLIWHNQLPEWLTSRSWENATLVSVMENHIINVVTHYKGHCYAWDVVNEAFNEDGTYRQTIWYNTIGPGYIALAFQLASRYDPKAKLYYNDYDIEAINNKSLAVFGLVKQLKAQGIKIDGVGLQAHFPEPLAPSYQQLVESMKLYTSLGVDVAITELDVFVEMPNSPSRVSRQAQIYADTFRACLDVSRCVGITVWGFYDPYSWVWGVVPGFGDPCLWWSNYTKKAAYFAIEEVLRK